jgi:signal transduction histidine kinase
MKKTLWIYRPLVKIIAFFLLIIMACITAACTAGAVLLAEANFYTRSREQIIQDEFYYIARTDSHTALYLYLQKDLQGALLNFETKNFSYEIYDAQGVLLEDAHRTTAEKPDFVFDFGKDSVGNPGILGGEDFKVKAYIDHSFSDTDKYSQMNFLLGLAYSLRYAVYVIGIIALLLTAVSFVFLMCGAGHRSGQEAVTATGLTKLPFDLLTGLLALGVLFVSRLFYENGYYFNDFSGLAAGILLVVCCIVLFSIGTAYCINFAARVKLGGWWKNTLIYRLLTLCLRLLKAAWRGLSILFVNLPLIWKTLLLLLVILGLELLAFRADYYNYSQRFIGGWVIERLLLVPAVLYLALVLRKLQKGGEALASGDLSYLVDTKYLVWDFRKHGENLNSIGAGMTHAVNARLKSERLKTELITNVSHDIKTPLTSIINYSDLICKEKTDNEKIAEYAEVLLRQSERLKKLIEDLVDASKASTGNVEVLLAPCEVGVLLAQTAGEYEQRLRESKLELITKQPEDPVRIMADGRHLWRVFDNLMSNICKYAQEGTRVYLSVETESGEALIFFKNTSRYALDISAGELLARFVRGDSARSTEGNGLGLSIAQSLTELQGGKMALTVDGDLFKVSLRFHCIP